MPSSARKIRGQFIECAVERTFERTHTTLNIHTGETTKGETETVTAICGSPLFSRADKVLGVCRSCLRGWSVPKNAPTENGLALIAKSKAAQS